MVGHSSCPLTGQADIDVERDRPQNKFCCQLEEAPQKILESAIDKLGFSARAYDRILKVSRTVADLSGSAKIRSEHVSEAIQYRSLDRNFWQSV